MPNLTYDKLFIGNEWMLPHSGRVISSIDPSTEEKWAEVPDADEVDVDRAVKAAQAAMQGPWVKKITASQRGAMMLKLADLIRRDSTRLAELESRDNGKPLKDTLGEVQRAIDWLTFFAGAADKIHGDQIPFRPDALAYTRREPVGVVGAILPWNSPMLMYSWKLGPALAAGNAIILKPSELTSVTAMELAKLALEAGFPPGVINVLPGIGETAGRALVAHRGVNKIALTGEHRTGQEIMKAAAGNLKRLTFELGGKSPHILFEDAALDRALIIASIAAFRSTGQSCGLGSRLFVHKKIYKQVVEQMAERARRVRVGMPLDKATHIGPHTSDVQRNKTESYIKIAKDEGARLVAGGGRPKGFPKGYFVEPTVFADVDNKSRLAQEEVFGPVLAIIPFETEEEVIKMANDTEYGLGSGLWTQDISRAHRVASQIQAGLVAINTFRPVHWMLPYGGFKMSGMGRENGMEVLHDYTEVKTVVVELNDDIPVDPFV